MKFKVAVIDDEKEARNLLKSMLEKYCPGAILIGEADGVASGFELLNRVSPDLVFLDIKMNDGSGFDLLKLLESVNFKLVFTTAYDEFAVKAFKFGAMDYLLKPINPIELKACYKRLPSQLNTKQNQIDIAVDRTGEAPKRIALSTNEGVHLVYLKEIIRLEGEGSYTRFYCEDGMIMVSKSLAFYEELLPRNTFVRVHQSHVINLGYIKTVMKSDGGSLLMTDNFIVPISRRKKDELFSLLEL